MQSLNTSLNIAEQELPHWMQLALRRTDWGILIVLIVTLLTGWFFITQEQLPNAPYYESTIWRIDEIAEYIQEGNIFPRWSYYAMQGYGSPIYHYTPPGASYAAAVISAMLTDDATQALRILILLILCLASGTLYSFLTRLKHARMGMLGSTLYLFNPFIFSTILFQLGDVDLLVIVALLPTLLWASHRLYCLPSAVNITLTAFTLAGILLTKPVFVIFGVVMMIGLLITTTQKTPRIHLLKHALFALLLGIGLSSFYHLPALLEADAVTWVNNLRILYLPELTLGTLLRLPQPIDTNLLFPRIQVTLGLWVVIIALIAVVLQRQQRHLGFTRFCLGVAIVMLGLAVRQNQLDYVVVSALCFAISGASVSEWSRPDFSMRRSQQSRLLTTTLIIMTMIFASPVWLVNANTKPSPTPSLRQYMLNVLADFGDIIIPPMQNIPSTLNNIPAPSRTVIQEYLNNQRSHIASNRAEGLAISLVNSSLRQQTYQFRSQSEQSILLQQAYFEGWRAYINSAPALITQDETTGLRRLQITSTVRGELVIQLFSTPTRQFAWFITLLTVVIVGLYIGRQRHHHQADIIATKRYLTSADARLIGLGMGAVFGMSALLALPSVQNSLPFALLDYDDISLTQANPLDYRTETGLIAHAYQVHTANVAHGDRLDIDIWWKMTRNINENLRVQVTLRNVTQSQASVQVPLRHPAFYPTQRWERADTVLDSYQIDIPDNLPAGRYTLSLRLIQCTDDCQTTQDLTFFDKQGTDIGTRLTLPQIITVSDKP
jgi:hypothetical protein